MAYRKLFVGDLVRVVDINHGLHNMDVVVIDAQEKYARVQYSENGTRCFDIPNRNLLVRHSAYHHIVDGRIDHDAKRQHDEKLRSEWNDRNVVDTEDECPYDDWDREDLIERINQLEKELDEHNVWK